jgi:hypothetical protein
MTRFAAAIVLCGTIVTFCPARDDKPKWEPPAPPDGWKAVASKDGTYYFALPKQPGRTGTRDHTFTINRVRIRSQINYQILKDGTQLEIEAASFAAPGLASVKVSDIFDAIVDGQRDEGFKVSEPKDVMVGDIKAKEYRLTKDQSAQRMVLFFVKPRFFAMTVAAGDAAKLDGEIADTYLKSLVIVPADVLKARAAERAAKNEEAGKVNLEKYGAKWTTKLAEMTPPDAPVVGVLHGKEFVPESVTIEPGNWLVFRKGKKGVFWEFEAKVWLLTKAGESIENKTYEIAAAATNPPRSPHISIATMGAGDNIPKTESFINRYALKLTLGAKNSDGEIPGTIYLCTPDSGKSFIAGQFTVKGK